MKLNRLESKFFDDILKTELDVPVHAALKYGETTLDIIVVPGINSQGHFLLKYFNASPYEPKLGDSGGHYIEQQIPLWMCIHYWIRHGEIVILLRCN